MAVALHEKLMRLYQSGQLHDGEKLLIKQLKKRGVSGEGLLSLLPVYRQPEMVKRQSHILGQLVSAARQTPALLRILFDECLLVQKYGQALDAVGYMLRVPLGEAGLSHIASSLVKISTGAVEDRAGLLNVLEALVARRQYDLALHVYYVRAKRECCDWSGLEELVKCCGVLVEQVLCSTPEDIIHPSLLMYTGLPEDLFRRLTFAFSRQLNKSTEQVPGRVLTPATDRKLRIGYISANFYNHAVGVLCFRMFGCHDRERFEIYVYSLRRSPGPYQNTIARDADVFRDVSSGEDRDIVRQIVEDEIDILVDMSGYADSGRPRILASRPAPIQISYLGYLNTMGPGIVDYIVADRQVIPDEHASMFSEKIIRLPQFMVASELDVPRKSCSRAECGLPENVFVFGSFNAPYKIDSCVFSSWMLILKKVPRSVLWLYSGGDKCVEKNLMREAGVQGVSQNHIIFAGKVIMESNLARIAQADLMLDTFLFNGGATTVSALFAGVPVLTLRGKTYLQRMGGSMNSCMGLVELDCTDSDEYVEKAVDLANNPVKLRDCRERVAANVHEQFAADRFVKSLELAYLKAWDIHLSSSGASDIREHAE